VSSLEDRVTALETEITRLREQVTDTHALAAHADRDVAEFREELRAQTRLLNATRLDLNDLRGDFNGLRTEVGELRGEMRAGFTVIGQMLDVLIERGGSE
jgi:chromosome segregation ATPase